MAMKYFDDVGTLEALRRQYRDLLKKHHPDNPNGSEEATKAINSEYEQLFKVLKDRHEHGSRTADTKNGKTAYDSMKFDTEEDERLREVLNQIIGFDNITIEIIGNWIWCFDSFLYRKELKELGFRYAHNKKAWYYHTEAFRKKSSKQLSMADIRSYYGSTEVEPEGRKKLMQA